MENEEKDEKEGKEADSPAAEAQNREGSRFPLANDVNGNPIQVPPQAVAWRVRRGGGRRGRPRNIFNAETGQQLEIPLGGNIQDLVDANVPPDRYLLYPIDENGQIIVGPVAVTEVTASEDDQEDDKPQGALDANSPNSIVGLAARQQQTIESLAAALERAIGNTTSGYAPVRAPAQLPPPVYVPPPDLPTVVTAPSSGGGGGVAAIVESLSKMDGEQMTRLAMMAAQVFQMFKGMMSGGGAAGGAAPAGAGP